MSVYKFARTHSTTLLATNGNADFSEADTNNGRSQSGQGSTDPGVAAGIALGTIVGVGLLLALILTGLKWRDRRKEREGKRAESTVPVQSDFHVQLEPQQSQGSLDGDMGSLFSGMTDLSIETPSGASAANWTTTSAGASPFTTVTSRGGERVTIADATMIDLRRLSGIVVDGSSSPRKGVFAQPDEHASKSGRPISFRRGDGNIRKIDVAATSLTTGAQYRHTQNLPLTPRTPRQRADSEGRPYDVHDDQPTSPLMPVQEPDNIAQSNGLGDRAWHRRRLSMPFLPSGGEYSSGSLDRTDTSGSSRYRSSGQSSPNWRPATGVSSSRGESSWVTESILEGSSSDGPPTPRAVRVDVASQIYDNDQDDDEPALSPSWIWTVSSIPELPDAGSEKTSKLE